MRALMAFSFVFAAVLGACSQPNPNHCANQSGDLKGDNYCKSVNADTPYCSSCIGDNNGCVADPVTDSSCEVGSTSVGEASTSAPTTSTSEHTSTSSTSTTSTSEPVTSSSSSTTVTADPSTTTTTTVDPSTTTSTESTGSTASTDTGGESTASTGDTTTTTGDSSTGTTDATSTGGPMCGDNLQEDPEICDGTDLNGLNCVTKNPTKYGGGALHCSGDCTAYDETLCCLAQDQPCTMNGQPCCPGTTCKLLMLQKCTP